ncbi:hypothetical protein CH373_14345 [Leptospira perolatii]|uniref:Uncharacterized protein n=1 Tax=Leptospira perolatii TaxID=2023191 RepID=A0A2M9ZJV7_9LEPT|nr:hypothetical protein [Leptospira perolatii]PJZ69281.1 hypothetical protein CH360_12275 [Leptospira perolatii]PJZ72337.1 hypothetical protein CH373_14345 [Leptospira perolatii]
MDFSKLPKGHWRGTYSSHILLLENFLRPISGKPGGEACVYLAGLIARRLDDSYSEAALTYLLEDPSEIDGIVRTHIPYIGQNAPIVTISKINAEFLSFSLAMRENGSFHRLEILAPKKLFSLASTFSYRSGNQVLGGIFGYFSSELDRILELLSDYLCFLGEEPSPFPPSSSISWSDRFESEKNERNVFKEKNPGYDLLEELPFDARVKTNSILDNLSGIN